jgi:nucleoredoxin
LADYYQKFAADKNFEIVFVSSDRDQGTPLLCPSYFCLDSFDEYYAEHPWLALPFTERDLKAQLSKKFKVSGIPSLIVLNSDAGLITANGRSKVSEDTECEDFPWVPPTFDQLLAGPLKSKTGDVTFDSLTGNTAVGFYFSAHWCPPCRL